MITKIVIVLFLIAILCCLGSALYYLLSGQGDSRKMARALSFRIGLSFLLFVLLLLGFATGVVKPHQFQLFVPANEVNSA